MTYNKSIHRLILHILFIDFIESLPACYNINAGNVPVKNRDLPVIAGNYFISGWAGAASVMTFEEKLHF